MADRARMSDVKHQTGFGTVAILCVAILYAPIVVLMAFSLNDGDIVTHWEGISTRWYAMAWADDDFRLAVQNTIVISMTATVLSTVLATLAAIGTTRVRAFRGQATSMAIVNLPLMVPEIVTAVGTLALFVTLAGQFGIDFGIGNLIIAHTVFCIPFAYMPISARLLGMDSNLETAAADLYASRFDTFRRVTLPLLMPGVFSGMALAFIVSFDDFTITQLLAGPGQTTLPLYIWSQIRRPMTPELNAVSTILLGTSILFVAGSFWLSRSRRQ